jgi:hypothetical protein
MIKREKKNFKKITKLLYNKFNYFKNYLTKKRTHYNNKKI